jgi:hypothetical protein
MTYHRRIMFQRSDPQIIHVPLEKIRRHIRKLRGKDNLYIRPPVRPNGAAALREVYVLPEVNIKFVL